MARTLSRTTTDHDEIRRWAEERGGSPAEVEATRRGKDDVGIIRIDFPGYSGEGKLKPISWDDWFQKFDEAKLALVIQDETAEGARSNFNKLVAREGTPRRARPAARGARRSAEDGRTSGRRAAAGASAARATSRKRSSTGKAGGRATASRRGGRSSSGRGGKGGGRTSGARGRGSRGGQRGGAR